MLTRMLAVVAFALTLAGCGESWQRASAEVDAEVACEDAVTARLKHPDRASFDHRFYRPAEGGEPAQVRGVVKTVNSFNAPVRVIYGCEYSGGQATVIELVEP
jgi:hypothetical protein